MLNILPAATPAPDFTLHATPDQTLALKDCAADLLFPAFYPADRSPVWGGQMALYNDVQDDGRSSFPIFPDYRQDRGAYTKRKRFCTEFIF